MSRPPNDVRRAVRHSLAAASRALLDGDARGMAQRLREAWRDSRDPTLAALYECLLEVPAVALPGPEPHARARAWAETAARAPGDPSVLASLLREPSHPAVPELDRLGALSAWAPDPLLASGLARRLRLPVVAREHAGAETIALETIRLLAAQRDPRAIPVLEQLARDPGLTARQRRNIRAAIDDLQAVAPVRLDPDTLAAMAPLERRAAELREREARSAELLAAIYADPDADAPRLVYADWLAALGDPRGEFISLQLARSGHGGPPSERERELLARHADEWAGVLHDVTSPLGRVFERGFLASVSVEAMLERERLIVPDWETMRSVDGHVALLPAYKRLDHLRSLYGFLNLRVFLELRADGRLGAVERFECSLADPNLRFDTPLGLRSLLVRRAFDEQLIELLASPACEGLEEFAVYYDGSPLGGPAWAGDHREHPALRARAELLRGRLPAHVRTLCLLDGHTSRATQPEGCTLRLERDTEGALSRLSLDVRRKHGRVNRAIPADAIAALLDELPLRSLSHVALASIDESVCERAALHEALRAAGLPTSDLPSE